MSDEFRVVALVAAYNEADIIGQVIADLIGQGVDVYLLDDGSTDGTVAAAQPSLNKGLIHIEQRAREPDEARAFSWTEILSRKQELARDLEADWFIHHDADEFRESPWAALCLRDAIRQVDRLGYNAIDFQLLNFRPTHDRFRPGDDVRKEFTFYEAGDEWDRAQVKCWKKTQHQVDLLSSAGHDVQFPGRRIFPLRFLLRHYPIRGQEHGERKVFIDRKPRFTKTERDRRWHIQYDTFEYGHRFIWNSSELVEYDPDSVRVSLTLQNRDVEALVQRARDVETEVADLRREKEGIEHVVSSQQEQIANLTARIETCMADIAAHTSELERRRDDVEKLTIQLQASETQAYELRETLSSEIHRRLDEISRLTRELSAVYGSISWRATQPIRTVVRRIIGR